MNKIINCYNCSREIEQRISYLDPCGSHNLPKDIYKVCQVCDVFLDKLYIFLALIDRVLNKDKSWECFKHCKELDKSYGL